MSNMKESVQEYYGQTLQQSSDLKTNACCTLSVYPKYILKALDLIHDEVKSKYYGCGLTIPNAIDGLKILDLGSGSGRDCYIASYLAGESGEVVGVDMTPEQLLVANEYLGYHTDKFNYKKSNVSFIKGDLENLDEIGLSNNYFDLIISNCVINLVEDKQKVLNSCFAKLQQGGEMYFSDVYVNKRISADLKKDPVIYSECLGGALYWNDFFHMAKKAGFKDPRIVESEIITIQNKELEGKLEGYEFYSVTFRLFKIDELEDDCEDYGHSVVYKGNIKNHEEEFVLDASHIFKKGVSVKVCGNSYLMLNRSRFKDYFEFAGDFTSHMGIFPGCGKDSPFTNSKAASCC